MYLKLRFLHPLVALKHLADSEIVRNAVYGGFVAGNFVNRLLELRHCERLLQSQLAALGQADDYLLNAYHEREALRILLSGDGCVGAVAALNPIPARHAVYGCNALRYAAEPLLRQGGVVGRQGDNQLLTVPQSHLQQPFFELVIKPKLAHSVFDDSGGLVCLGGVLFLRVHLKNIACLTLRNP